MDTGAPCYSHTQKSPIYVFVYGTAIALFVGSCFVYDEFRFALIVGGVFMLILGMAFDHLTVMDLGDRLAIRFGPLPLFRKTMHYADIEKVEIGRTLILEGWGIHYSIRGGWVWNLWGRDCVVVHSRKGVLRVGTDNAAALAGFLNGKIGQEKK
jgi:hypothetical protein